MSHPLFGPELRSMLADRDDQGLKAFCESLHPATAVEALEDFEPAEVWAIISPADIRTQAAIFEYLPPARQAEMVEGQARPQVGALITKMSHDDRVDLLRRLPARVKESLLRLVDEADRRDIATLFTYAENSVGALMTTDYAWLPPTLTAAEAVDQLRQQAPDKETIYYVFILDEPRKRADGGGMAPRPLLGVVSLRDLILAPRQTLLRDLIGSDELVTVRLSDDREVAAETLAQYDFIALPVLDDTGGMVGIVTHDDVIDVIRQEATEDLQKQAGVSPIAGGYADASLARLWWSRAKWLVVLFLAELLTFTVMARFQETIDSVVVLALFVPLCISVGGNSGTQASTVVTRALALGEIDLANWWMVVRREVGIGLLLGATLGGFGFVRAALTPADTIRPGFPGKTGRPPANNRVDARRGSAPCSSRGGSAAGSGSTCSSTRPSGCCRCSSPSRRRRGRTWRASCWCCSPPSGAWPCTSTATPSPPAGSASTPGTSPCTRWAGWPAWTASPRSRWPSWSSLWPGRR